MILILYHLLVGFQILLSFPYKEIAESAAVVFKDSSDEALQYGSTEGYKPLRDYIAKRYQNSGLDIIQIIF